MTEKEWSDYCSRSTDAPAVFHKFSRIILGAALLEGRVSMKFGHGLLFPNLWACIVAPSSTFRKSTVLTVTRSIIESVNPPLIYPQEFSQEKLIEIFCLQPSGVMMAYEFQTLLGILSRDYNAGLRALLTELYDCPKLYQRVIRERTFEIIRPTISIFGATTSDWLMEKSQASDFRGGFLSRFIFIPAFKKEVNYYLPQTASTEDWKHIAGESVKIRNMSGEITVSSGAEMLFKEWAKNHEDLETEVKKIPRILDAYWVRMETAVLKMAIVESCWVGESEISIASMRDAIQKAEYLKSSILELYGDAFAFDPEALDRQTVIRALKLGPLTKQALMSETQLGSWHFGKAVKTLREMGRLSMAIGETGTETFSLVEEKSD